MWNWLKPSAPKPAKPAAAVEPEAAYKLSIEGGEVVLAYPGQPERRAAFDELTEVVIETNDSGPWGADVWWLLSGAGGQMVLAFPQGATGEQAVVERLIALPGFDHAAMADAMCCTNGATFPVWRAPGTEDERP